MSPANIESMAYSRQEGIPWHQEGVAADGLMTAQDLLQKAGLSWEVYKDPAYVRRINESGQEYFKPIKFNSITRSIEGQEDQHYHCPGQDWTPIQNHEAFGFFDTVIGEGQAVYDTAGAIGVGEKIWILAKMPGILSINGDPVKKYITMVNSHNGSFALQMFWTPIRIVCQNTLKMAMMDKTQSRFYARHTKGIKDRAMEAREILGIAEKWFEEFGEKAKYMAITQIPTVSLDQFVKASLGVAADKPDEELSSQTRNASEAIKELCEVGTGIGPKIRGTQWAAYNGVVEFVDYYRKPRGDKHNGRLDASMFGSGNLIKNRAWNYLQAVNEEG